MLETARQVADGVTEVQIEHGGGGVPKRGACFGRLTIETRILTFAWTWRAQKGRIRY